MVAGSEDRRDCLSSPAVRSVVVDMGPVPIRLTRRPTTTPSDADWSDHPVVEAASVTGSQIGDILTSRDSEIHAYKMRLTGPRRRRSSRRGSQAGGPGGRGQAVPPTARAAGAASDGAAGSQGDGPEVWQTDLTEDGRPGRVFKMRGAHGHEDCSRRLAPDHGPAPAPAEDRGLPRGEHRRGSRPGRAA